MPSDAGDGGFMLPTRDNDEPRRTALSHCRRSPAVRSPWRTRATGRRCRPHSPARSGPLTAVVTPVRCLLQPIPGGLGELVPVQLRPGQAADLEEVLARLVELGYARADLVERRGEVAVRGGILDVFPPTEEHPVRVEFFGDTVEEIRYFKVADQRSLEIATHGLWAPPCRELLLTQPVRERAAALAGEQRD